MARSKTLTNFWVASKSKQINKSKGKKWTHRLNNNETKDIWNNLPIRHSATLTKRLIRNHQPNQRKQKHKVQPSSIPIPHIPTHPQTTTLQPNLLLQNPNQPAQTKPKLFRNNLKPRKPKKIINLPGAHSKRMEQANRTWTRSILHRREVTRQNKLEWHKLN